MPIGVPEAINNYFLDWVEAGSVQDDWLALYEKGFANFYVNPSELADKKPPKHPVPAKPDSFYTGTYDNPYYGPIKIVAEGKTLHLLIGWPVPPTITRWGTGRGTCSPSTRPGRTPSASPRPRSTRTPATPAPRA